MRKFVVGCTLLGLALAAGLGITGSPAQPVGPPNEVLCNRINNSSSGPTTNVAVAAVPNQSISVCGFLVNAAGAGTFQLTSGTGATCSGGAQTITPVLTLAANATIVDHNASAAGTLPILNNICVVITGTGPIAYTIYYAQF